MSTNGFPEKIGWVRHSLILTFGIIPSTERYRFGNRIPHRFSTGETLLFSAS